MRRSTRRSARLRPSGHLRAGHSLEVADADPVPRVDERDAGVLPGGPVEEPPELHDVLHQGRRVQGLVVIGREMERDGELGREPVNAFFQVSAKVRTTSDGAL